VKAEKITITKPSIKKGLILFIKKINTIAKIIQHYNFKTKKTSFYNKIPSKLINYYKTTIL